MSTKLTFILVTMLVLSIVCFERTESMRLFKFPGHKSSVKGFLKREEDNELPSDHLSVDQIPVYEPENTSNQPESDEEVKITNNCSALNDDDGSQNEDLYPLDDEQTVVVDKDYPSGSVTPPITGVFNTFRHYVRIPKLIRGLNMLLDIQETLVNYGQTYFL